MNIWITSDWHRGHQKEFLYIPRGFTSPEEMEKEIIRRHNELVQPDDVVYCLGDCVMGTDSADSRKFIESLNGNIVIIRGNHCTDNKIDMYLSCKNVITVVDAYWLKYEGYNFYLSHFPTLTSNLDDDKPLKARVINLCGHSHTKDKFADMDKGMIYHCEMDAHDCRPVLLDNIIEDLKNKISL